MIQAIITTIAVLLVVGYIYSRWDISPPQYDWLYEKHDEDNEPHKCPHCGR
jgi:hypothetical protein